MPPTNKEYSKKATTQRGYFRSTFLMPLLVPPSDHKHDTLWHFLVVKEKVLQPQETICIFHLDATEFSIPFSRLWGLKNVPIYLSQVENICRPTTSFNMEASVEVLPSRHGRRETKTVDWWEQSRVFHQNIQWCDHIHNSFLRFATGNTQFLWSSVVDRSYTTDPFFQSNSLEYEEQNPLF